MLTDRSAVGVLLAWLYVFDYSIPTLGELFLMGCIMSPYSDLGVYN